MKKALQIAIVALLAIVISKVSGLIRCATDTKEKETIGVQSHWGFPVPWRTTAPGLAWARTDVCRFGLNTASWFCVIDCVWIGVKRARQLKRFQ